MNRLFEAVAKESDLETVAHTTDNNETASKVEEAGNKTELEQATPVLQLGALEASIREHRLFKAQKEKHAKDDEQAEKSTNRSGSLFGRVLGGRKRSNSIISSPLLAMKQRNEGDGKAVKLDNKTKSLMAIRDKVAPAISDGSFKTALTYVKKEDFFSRLKKAPKSTLKQTASSLQDKASEKTKEKLTDDLGETIGGIAETAEKIADFRENLHEALANGNFDQVKALILQKAGETAPAKFIMNAVEWVCKKFAGKKESDLARGVEILENISLVFGPIGGGIKTLQKTYKSVKIAYELFKKRHETTTDEKVSGVGEAVTNALEAASEGVQTISGLLDKFDFVKSIIGTAVPIIGSAISIAVNGVSIIIKAYQAIKAFVLKSKASEVAKSFVGKASLTKFFSEKSNLFRKYQSFDEKAAKAKRDELKLNMQNGNLTKEETTEYEDLESYLLYQNLKSYNRKRGVRAVIHIGEKLINTGAEIANIVGVATQGVGVAVGTGMKAAVTIGQIGRKVYNTTKQFARDHLSSHIGLFNKDKTTTEKNKTYYDNAYAILRRIGGLPNYKNEDAEIKAQYEQSHKDLELANCSVYRLSEENSMDKIRDFLIKCMKKRE